jgi:glucokinase
VPNQNAPTPQQPLLVADIGGTNARLAIAQPTADNTAPILSDFQVFSCADFKDFSAILGQYLGSLEGPSPLFACLAAAGPIIGDTVHITNLGWHLNAPDLTQKFGFENLRLVNDFAALARATPILGGAELITLAGTGQSGTGQSGIGQSPDGPISVMGPGTGFGLALLVRHGADYTVVSCEGGHVSFMPSGALETKVWQALQQSIGRVTVETLLSGVGLMRIYRELCHIEGITPLNYDPRTISNQALDHGDAVCLKTLAVFCSVLGSVAGDVVLSHGSTGGIYLGGGILPKIADFFLKSAFTERFLDKPPLQDFISKVPVHLIVAPDAALKGAALLFGEDIPQE